MYDGIVNVYKEKGYTSHDVVARMRGIYGQKKIGHTGTLDPMAEGVLIICLGRATKLSEILTSEKKSYTATMLLGQQTDTDDITGNVIKSCENDKLDEIIGTDEETFRIRLEEVLRSFTGKGMQMPPIYSAIKKDGKKLYEYAREGKSVDIEKRPIEVYKLQLTEISGRYVSFETEVSKGTYIRSLIRDIGEELGTFATMSALVRDEVMGLKAEDGYRIDELIRLKEENSLGNSVLPMDLCLHDVPVCVVNERGRKYLENGNRLGTDMVEIQESVNDTVLRSCKYFRVYMDGELRALYQYDKEHKNYKVFKML